MQKPILTLIRLGLFLLAWAILASGYAQSPVSARLQACDTEAICAGETATLSVALQGTAPFSLRYTDGKEIFTQEVNSTTASLTVRPQQTSTYKLLSVRDAGTSGSVSGQATIGVNPCSPQGKGECGSTCFQTQILKQESQGSCTNYTLEISHSGNCRYALSHFSISVPCGTVSQVSNSGGWPMEIGSTDPTTGITGIKIDDIKDFGESNRPQSFTVSYTVCNADCEPADACGTLVAYKAGQCVNYEVVAPLYTPMELSLAAEHNTCFGEAEGKIESLLTGGKAPYTYQWNTGAGSETINGLPAGKYSLTVSDASGAQLSASTEITAPSALDATLTPSPASCGNSDGALELSVQGGTAPYTYSWSNGSTDEDVSNLAAGAYTVTITDANGCQLQLEETLEGSQSLNVRLSQASACEGGMLMAEVSGGTAPYNYAWNTGATDASIVPDAAGTYSLTLTDAAGCSTTASLEVLEISSPLSLGSLIDNASCQGAADGSIDLSVNGGSAPYSYAWSNGSTEEDLYNLSAGSYSVTVTDAQGCTLSKEFTVSQGRSLFIRTEEQSNVACDGTLGSISLSTFYGTAPYTYEWSNGQTGSSLTDLEAGFYRVTVTDANGCQSSRSFEIQQATPPQATISGGDCSNPTLSVQTTGGTAPYTYEWSTGQTGSSITPDSAGTYSVLITDASGCSSTASVEVSDPAQAISLSLSTTAPLCYGDSNGSIDLTIEGGIGSYEIVWSDGSTTEDLEGLKAGTYTVTVSDANGCTVSASASLQQPRPLFIRADAIQHIGCDGSLGSISLSTFYGTAPYTYQWSHGATGSSLTDLEAGFYRVTVSDANGCQYSRSFEIQPAAMLQLSISESGTCGSESLSAQVQGGNAPYTYSWSNGEETVSIQPTEAGEYTLNVSDAAGCTATASFTYQPKNSLELRALTVAPSCAGAANGSADLILSGGTAPYVFDWTNGATTEDINGLAAGVYSVLVRDAAGCEASLAFKLEEPEALQLQLEASDAASCGQENGALNIAVSGGLAPYTYSWSDGDTSEDRLALAAGTYELRVSDAAGCALTGNFTVEEQSGKAPTASLNTCGETFLCRGESLDVEVSFEGTGPYTLSYTDGLQVYTATSEEKLYTLSLSPQQSSTFRLLSVANACSSAPAEGQLNVQLIDCQKACEEDCFSTELIALEQEGSCQTYTLEVSTDGSCARALSHFNVAVGCGHISQVWNSEGWPVEIGTDPTTGITGIKVDEIRNFGEDGQAASFQLRYTLCGEESCELAKAPGCGPLVAYKAGNCTTYDQAQLNLGGGSYPTQQAALSYPSYQLAPNPLSSMQAPYIQVSDLKETTSMHLSITNMHGYPLKSIRKELSPATKGFYLEPLNLPSGIYLLHFETCGFVQSLRLQIY